MNNPETTRKKFIKENITESALAAGREVAAKERRLRELQEARGRAATPGGGGDVERAATAAKVAEIKKKLREAAERIANA